MRLLPRNYAMNLFDDFFNDPFFSRSFEDSKNALMKTDIKDQGDSYLLDIEIPGFKKEDVRAELKNGYLTISASHTEEKEENDEANRYVRKERYSGSCQRSFYVGENIRQEDIKAGFENGILKLSVPKQAPKAIEETHNYIPIE